FDDMERRMVMLPPEAGNIGTLRAVSGKVIFIRYPNNGSADEKTTLIYYDLDKREEKTIISDINDFEISADGKKLIVSKNGSYYIIDIALDQKADKVLRVNELETMIRPQEEWAQIFHDSWRFMRDFFYDKNMHGVDWQKVKQDYGALVSSCVDRADINFLIGEMIGELDASHTYRGGGAQETPKHRAVGYLGVDWAKKDGHFQIAKIIRGAVWDYEVKSPLDEPGLQIKE